MSLKGNLKNPSIIEIVNGKKNQKTEAGEGEGSNIDDNFDSMSNTNYIGNSEMSEYTQNQNYAPGSEVNTPLIATSNEHKNNF